MGDGGTQADLDRTSPVRPDNDPASRSIHIDRRDGAVVVGTLALWAVIMALAGRASSQTLWATSSWGRWDTGHYLNIADSGYAFGHCDGVPNRGPSDYCGNSGWFPGYPYAIRVLSKMGLEPDDAGRLISWVMLALVVVVLWFGFLRRRPTASGVLGMALAAAFPASVYYGAIFPISTMLVAALVALVALDRQRWLIAGLAGAVAAICYSSGIVLGLLALVPLISPSIGDVRRRVGAAVTVGAPIAFGYALVLLNFQRATGHWDAWFKTMRSYHLSATLPWVMIRRQIAHIGGDAIPAAIGLQTMFVGAIIVAAAYVVVRDRGRLSFGERGAAVLTAGLWLLPLTLGGDLSLYRAESLLLPSVILLSRLRPLVLAPFVIVAIPLCYRMAQLFFDATLM